LALRRLRIVRSDEPRSRYDRDEDAAAAQLGDRSAGSRSACAATRPPSAVGVRILSFPAMAIRSADCLRARERGARCRALAGGEQRA
jgi:hypothetical protein